jgi:ATP-dependent DNA helicase RecG
MTYMQGNPTTGSTVQDSNSSAAAPQGLATPVQFARGVGPRLAATLGEKLGLHTVEDLLLHFPLRYEDRRNFRPLAQVQPGEAVVVSGTVLGATGERSRRGLGLVKATIRDNTGIAELVFFNQPWLERTFIRLRGKQVSVYGTAQCGRTGLTFQHPEWEELGAADDALHLHRIVPVHPATEGLTPRMLRSIIGHALERFGSLLQDTLPPELVARRGLMPYGEAVRQIHFPESEARLEAARSRLVFEELFRLQCVMALRKRALVERLPGISHRLHEEDLEELRRSLPFPLTAAQVRVIGEIRADMAAPRPMNRLLQGDVGSGKTVAAAAAILTAARGGYQAAVLVPTEILAEQHYAVFRRLLEPLQIRVHRLVGSVRAAGKRQIKQELASGFAHVVVGTHALLQDDVEFHRLGLVVVDEQHRFGVLQRLTLLDKGLIEHTPDMLVMTATPIPRTLALTVYGDLDVSVVDELPPGRKPVKTHWKGESSRASVYAGVRRLVQEGRQVYYVCPLVEQSDKLQARAATEIHAHLSTEIFPDLRVGLLHGQMPSHEKDAVMDAFREGEYDILVATVVIEVGVDVPNAACIVIEDAGRFGLAQLHQLRGRVGRGEHQAYCVLLGDPGSEEARRRLEVMVRTSDGFEIADEDLALRGPGEFLGTRQSGLLKLRIANIIGDAAILREARSEAFRLVERDPELTGEGHGPLGEDLRRRYSEYLLALTG